MADDIQEQCVKNAENPYAEWYGGDIKQFNTWLSVKIKVVTTESDGVVYNDSTREALLSQPSRSIQISIPSDTYLG